MIADEVLVAEVAGADLQYRDEEVRSACCGSPEPGSACRVIVLESAVPLLAVAAVAIGTGFGASALYATMEMRLSLVTPDAAYYVMTSAGIVLALGVIVATFPVLRRITGPETVRSE